jgi:hypothetical protein
MSLDVLTVVVVGVLVLILFLARRIANMTAALDRISEEVTDIGNVVDGAVTLINNLAQEIRDNIGSEPALNALADTLDAKARALAEAVAANTTSAPDAENAAR